MASHPTTIVAALAAELATNPGRPLVTYYDDATGERIELSVKTFDNWVSKITNLFVDELMLEPGDPVVIDLPAHWQSTVIAVAAWTAGLRLLMTDSAPPAVRVVGPAATDQGEADAGHVLVCSLRPMGASVAEPLPAGWLDFAAEVAPQPDTLLAPSATGPGDVAVVSDLGMTSHGELVDLGRRAANESGLEPGGRLLTDLNPVGLDGFATALVAPLVTSASVVVVAHADEDRRAAIADQERITCLAWSTR